MLLAWKDGLEDAHPVHDFERPGGQNDEAVEQIVLAGGQVGVWPIN